MLIGKMIIFVIATAGILYISRVSLTRPGSHGYYRFFAWEAILVLALINIDVWFQQPLSWYQMISWPLLMIALFLIIHAVWVFKQTGQQDAHRSDAPMLGFEKTTRLVTTGAYRYIRHPMYSSLLFLAWGIFFKMPHWPGGLLAAAATFLLVLTARADETEDIRFFGQAYLDYMKRTKRFVPFLF
jgi:protein-S-isoprenylcysteine O-methyltransferase Ste14